MAAGSNGYWSRSWALLTRDEGWIKPLLVLGAACMVPVVGPFGADGYALEWARLTSWGVDSSPKQKNVDVGGCIRSGARGFVVMLGYVFAFALVRAGLRLLLGRGLGGLLGTLLALCVGVLVTVAKLRATIYQTIGAGYQVNRIWDMVRRDHKGLLRIVGMALAMGMVVGFVASILMGAALAPHMGGIVRAAIEYERYGSIDDTALVAAVFTGLGAAMPAMFVVGYLMNIAGSGVSLLLSTAAGLWMRQFDVSRWGESPDPLPAEQPALPTGGAVADVTVPWGAQTSVPAQPAPESYVPQEYVTSEPAHAVERAAAVPQAMPDLGAPEPRQTSEPVMFALQTAGEATAPECADGLPDDAQAALASLDVVGEPVAPESQPVPAAFTTQAASVQAVPEPADSPQADEQAAPDSLDVTLEVMLTGEPLDTGAASNGSSSEQSAEDSAQSEVPTFSLGGGLHEAEAASQDATRPYATDATPDEVLRQVEEAIRETDMTVGPQDVALASEGSPVETFSLENALEQVEDKEDGDEALEDDADEGVEPDVGADERVIDAIDLSGGHSADE